MDRRALLHWHVVSRVARIVCILSGRKLPCRCKRLTCLHCRPAEGTAAGAGADRSEVEVPPVDVGLVCEWRDNDGIVGVAPVSA